MRRREFLLSGAVAAAPQSAIVMTVRGPIDPARMGVTLPHEHFFSTFGAPASEKASYDIPKVLDAVVPYAESVKRLGCRTIADCTAAYFGRDPRLLKIISERTGLNVLTNTGYYGSANERYIPDRAYKESAAALAARFLKEWRDGIEDSGIRPGFIKLGINSGELPAINRKLLQAAARTHLESGLTIAVHTGDNVEAASQQIAVLKDEGVSPQAWIWVHAHAVKDTPALVAAAKMGAWLEFDGLEPSNVDLHLNQVKAMRNAGVLGRVLLSHDGNSFRVDGRPPRPYDALWNGLLPALRRADFSEREIHGLVVDNPREALTIRVRKL